jgi:hypothetical protein
MENSDVAVKTEAKTEGKVWSAVDTDAVSWDATATALVPVYRRL